MKIPKINKQSISNFFLYNIEKVILGVSMLLLGLFFYLGLGAEKFEDTPDKLVSQANQATSHIKKTSNWELIQEYRKGDVEVSQRIQLASQPLDSTGYKVEGFSMIPKMLQLRSDPPLPEVIDLEAHSIRTSIAVRLRSDNTSFQDPLLILPVAKQKFDPNDEAGSSVREFLSQEEELEALEDDSEFEEGSQPKKSGKKKRDRDKDPQDTYEVDSGSGFPGVQEAYAGGLRPANVGISPGNSMTLKRNVVVVNGLVEHRKLWQQTQKVLSNSVGWYPHRDLPQYEFLQVERRTVENGRPTEWVDKSEWINFDQAEWYPGSFVSGPEIVPAGNFDRNLTNAIPPIMEVDYVPYALHSKLQKRVFIKVEKEEEGPSALDALEGKKVEDEEENRFGSPGFNRSGRREKNSLVKGGGLGFGFDGSMAFDQDAMGSEMMGFGIPTDGRTSSNMTEYTSTADPTAEPDLEFKAVRFFDMQVSAKEPVTYQYRIRLWLKDPNATDPEATRNDNSFDEMRGMGDGEEEEVFEKVDINFSMQDEAVRNRLKMLAEEEDDEGEPVYYVSEFYGEDAATKVKVPKGFEYLRFARPTKWSEPITVTVGTGSPNFFAESVNPPRTATVNETEFPIEEPKVELITKVESPVLNGLDIASKKKLATGDLVNYTEAVTVMHPVSRSVHFVQDAGFNTQATLVDVMGGERLPTPKSDPVEYALPGESLVMGNDGGFAIVNDIEQRADARHALRLPDEKAEYGRKKRRKKRVNPNDPFGIDGP